jgi:hypothetical protein
MNLTEKQKASLAKLRAQPIYIVGVSHDEFDKPLMFFTSMDLAWQWVRQRIETHVLRKAEFTARLETGDIDFVRWVV